MGGELCENKSSRAISSSTDLYYPDHASSSNPNVHSHMMNLIQSFDSNSEMFNSSTGLEMIRLSKNLEQQSHDGWKCYFGKKPSQPCPSKLMNESTNDFYFTKHDFNAGTSGTSREINNTQVPWQESRFHVDESNSIFRGVFPSEGNQRPISQGLSLSLSSNNPSNIGLQSFESRHANYNHHGQHDDNSIMFDIPTTSRDRFHGQSTSTQRQRQFMQDGLLGESSSFYQHGQFQMRLSKYLSATQELLNEFCSLGTKQDGPLKKKFNKSELIVDDEHGIGSSSLRRQQPLHSFDFMDLQKRKTKLLLMLEEVDKRYRHDRDQMKAVVSPFEAIAGLGSASVYTALASKAMSRHFKCLRDAIVEQIQGIKKAMGDKDQAVPGSSRGETPRLRILDQSFRQQKAMQQMTMMDSSPWRPQRGLPERSVSILRAWLFEHFLNPYPTDVDKHILARQTGLSRSQVSNWFINARVRLWKPMVEEMYLEELKEQENTSSSGRAPEDSRAGQNPPDQEEKPTQEQLIQLDSQSLPSIVQPKDDDRHHNTSVHGHHNNIMPQQNQCFGRVGETLGVMDLDFASYNASYNHNPGGSVSYKHESVVNHSVNSGGGVSLTLGLQQHGESAGMSLAFSPAQSSLFYTRENIEDCQPVHYSLIDGEEQNQPYRNLMGAQILHDFAE